MGNTLARLLTRIFGRSTVSPPAGDGAAWKLYGTAVAQARQPGFYSDIGVPDTLDGRFDMIVLHVSLLVRRLRDAGEAGRGLAQALFDATFDDMDRSLREMGVGDLGVGRRVKDMARAFYGRAAAYEQALEDDDTAALAAALGRNILAGRPDASAEARILAAYVRESDRTLWRQDGSNLLLGEARFASPPGKA